MSDEHPFANFEANLREVDPELDGLEPPTTPELIDAVETQLDVKLPPSFALWLRHYNGGTLYNTTIYGVEAEDDFDLAEVNLRDREEGLPTHLVAFANALSGDVYCFDTSLADDSGESPVFLLDPEEGTLASVAASFRSWLERLPRLEAELAEVRGPQPMTIDEWEEFLTRERAKLRRLSETPAHKLTMPDPEKVRAELGGKIPVDPRHLKSRD
ncbi:MAG: SMI1/KNR4 family protein [Planctomycetes bacterium]|nr:SMI1/KNR4 family protein [Planctomycetota bacterium]